MDTTDGVWGFRVSKRKKLLNRRMLGHSEDQPTSGRKQRVLSPWAMFVKAPLPQETKFSESINKRSAFGREPL